jgi:diguanylate cyclase (GGDEF)-like protein
MNRIAMKLQAIGFRQQLAIAFCGGIIIAILASSTLISLLSWHTIRDRFLLDSRKSAQALAMQSTLALLYHSAENGRLYAKTLLSSPDVIALAIVDLDNHRLLALGDTHRLKSGFATSAEKVAQTIETPDEWSFFAPVFSTPTEAQAADSPFTVIHSSPELLGYVELVVSKKTLHKVVGNIVRTNILVSVILAAALLAVLLAITRQVTKPIRRLAHAMRQASSGEKKIRAEVGGPKDIVAMQVAFNHMIEALEAREQELEHARDAAVESARIKGEFAATVSHELRTPLNGVLGMLELLQGMALNPKQADYVEVAKDSAESLLALVNDILDFSRNDSGQFEIQAEDFDVRAMLDDIIGLTGSQARRKGLDLGFTVASDVPHFVNGDNRRLQQILLNLIGNAVKFTETGEVAIRVECIDSNKEGFRLSFEVADTGIGISEEARDWIFEPFRQEDGSTTRKYGGSGLGLAICKQLVERLGGEITLSSVKGYGSTFRFTLPFAAARRRPAPDRADSELAGASILIVDDSEPVRQMIRETCDRWGMKTLTAETLQEMVKILRASKRGGAHIDLVLIDDGMRGNYGQSAIDLIASDPIFLKVGTVIMSATVKLPQIHHPAIKAWLDKPVRSALLYKSLLIAVGSRDKPVSRRDNSNSTSETPLVKNFTAHALVVEDNRSNQMVMSGMLERLGVRSTIACNGREAIELIQRERFDIVFMDCNMPEMNGLEAASRIRALGGWAADVPIIAMTANVQEEAFEKCLAAGMNAFVGKPLSLAVLEAVLTKWLEAGCENRPQAVAPAAGPDDDFGPTLDRDIFNELKSAIGDAFPRMLRVFMEDVPRYLDKLRFAIETGDIDSMQLVAHTLRGSAAITGAVRLAEICKRIEMCCGNNDISTAAPRGSEAEAGRIARARALESMAVAEAEALKAVLRHEMGDAHHAEEMIDNARGTYILVADDDRSTRFAFRNVLEEEGYTVIEANDGAKAIEICKHRPPDMILMDAKMSVMDGFTACQLIKQQPQCAHIPILIVTSLDDEDSIERAFAVGATDYISKPINFSVLRRRIAHLMQASHAERSMKRLAYSDTLTGLPNRVLFTKHLSQLLQVKRENGQPLSVMFLDVDRFKLINDTMGHNAGDTLLKIVAERLQHCVRDNDLVARLGGDEFTIVIDNVGSRDVLATIARKIRQTFNRPIAFLDQEIFVSLSIGISQFPADANDLTTLMKHADTAMFHAKRYRNDFRFFEEGMEEDASRRLELENDLRRAIERNELCVFYQPQAATNSGEITGMEALVRWRHPERGLVPPADFISLAEDAGLIGKIGDIVLRESCRQLRIWLNQGYGPLRMAVNISGRQIERHEILGAVANVLIGTQIPADHLELEITESVVMQNAEDMISVFHELKKMNLHLAIDDFGTGYSSLSYLKRFPVDTIKIDRSFIQDIPQDSEDVGIVTGVIAMAKGLGLKVVAEGVENASQQEFLKEKGCDYIQGYYLSEPLPPEEFERRFLNGRRREGSNVTVLKRTT